MTKDELLNDMRGIATQLSWPENDGLKFISPSRVRRWMEAVGKLIEGDTRDTAQKRLDSLEASRLNHSFRLDSCEKDIDCIVSGIRALAEKVCPDL